MWWLRGNIKGIYQQLRQRWQPAPATIYIFSFFFDYSPSCSTLYWAQPLKVVGSHSPPQPSIFFLFFLDYSPLGSTLDPAQPLKVVGSHSPPATISIFFFFFYHFALGLDFLLGAAAEGHWFKSGPRNHRDRLVIF